MTTNYVPLIDVYRLADVLDLPVKWLQDETDAGRIPFLQVGEERRFAAPAVHAVLVDRAGKVPPRRPPSLLTIVLARWLGYAQAIKRWLKPLASTHR